ncbi:hypothetical protein E2C01_075288 [Portunus trituberculatus]|uniref:Uncharacterized protein n=1 Tax=Portunus trituberculatus TaxID=210409 RepID=A0A5B7I854_PORTR|nr:hypothetical protein [Portunus trituberculatus]
MDESSVRETGREGEFGKDRLPSEREMGRGGAGRGGVGWSGVAWRGVARGWVGEGGTGTETGIWGEGEDGREGAPGQSWVALGGAVDL